MAAATPTAIKGTSITAPTADSKNHQVVLQQLKETTEIAQRQRGDPNDSFVRVSEFTNVTGAKLVNDTLQPAALATSTATVNVLDSITGTGSSSSPLQLYGDTASPGNTMLYGTNASGVKGWYAQPSGGGSGSLTLTDGTHSVSGTTQITVTGGTVGGTSPNATLTISTSGTVSVQDSITGTGSVGSPLQLSGDSASPGNSMVYGTSSGGVKGWYAAGGSGYTPPVTTKGDLFGYSTTPGRFPVGTNGYVLTADSTQAFGLRWGSAPSSSYAATSIETSASIPITNYNWPPYWAPRYGIIGDGATDNTTAMQAAQNLGVPIFYPSGTYCYTNITAPWFCMVGAGYNSTIFETTDLSANNSITMTTSDYAPEWRNCAFTTSGSKSGGYAIWIQPTSGECNSPRLIDVFINGYPNGFGGTAVSGFYFGSGSQIYGSNLQTGILVRNDNDADSGDSVIEGTINATNQTAVLIYQQSSGGLKVNGAKLLGGLHHIYLNWANTGNSSDLLVTGGSSEGAYGDHILIARQTGSTKTFTNVDITGMQFQVTSPAGNNWAINASDASGFLSNVNIKVTVHNYNTAGGGVKLDYISVSAGGKGGGLVNGCTMIGSGGSSVGVYLGTNNYAGSVKYGINSITGFGTTIAPSTTATVNEITYQDTQTATATIAAGSFVAFGNVYRANITLNPTGTFALVAPLSQQTACITDAAGSAGGGIAANVYSVSDTAIAVSVINATASAVNISATMYGVI